MWSWNYNPSGAPGVNSDSLQVQPLPTIQTSTNIDTEQRCINNKLRSLFSKPPFYYIIIYY